MMELAEVGVWMWMCICITAITAATVVALPVEIPIFQLSLSSLFHLDLGIELS